MNYLKSGFGVLMGSIVAATVLQGCTFSAPQLGAIMNFTRNITNTDNNVVGDTPATWLASFGDRGSVLHPYTASGLIVFANADGDAVAFDGWMVKSISGFGLSMPISISGKEGVRTFSGALGQFSTSCSAWELNDQLWSQSCDNGKGFIELNEKGNIEVIIVPLGERWGIVTLRVAKKDLVGNI